MFAKLKGFFLTGKKDEADVSSHVFCIALSLVFRVKCAYTCKCFGFVSVLFLCSVLRREVHDASTIRRGIKGCEQLLGGLK